MHTIKKEREWGGGAMHCGKAIEPSLYYPVYRLDRLMSYVRTSSLINPSLAPL